MAFKRTKASADVVGQKSLDLTYNDRAGAYKMLGPILGKPMIMGSLAAAKGISQAGALVAVFNNSAAVAFVKTGTMAVTAPTGGADGIPVPAYSYLTIAMGDDVAVIGSAATLFGYEILDESSYSPSNS